MNLTNCICCGKLQLASGGRRCLDCMRKYLEDSHKIKRFLEEHPRATVMDVYNQTGVSLKRINEVVSTNG